MMKKIYALTDWVIATPKRSWWTMIGMILLTGILGVIGTLIIPGASAAGVVGIFFATIILLFVVLMIIGGLLNWASHLLGFEKRSFSRALGALSAHAVVLVIPTIILLALSPLAEKGAISIIFWLFYLAIIVFAFVAHLYVFARAYNVTKGKAFGLAATAYGLFAWILAGIMILIMVFTVPFVSDFAKNSPFAEIDFEAYNSLELDLDESTFEALGSVDYEAEGELRTTEE